MAGSSLMYSFEGLTEDLPRPSMAAIRGLLSAGVLVSARAWQELPVATRQEFARQGAHERIDPQAIAELLKSVPVSQLKLIGKKGDPSADHPSPELLAALGRVRQVTLADWKGLRALDRYVLEGLVKNTRLLWRAIDEMLPSRALAAMAGPPSGAVARCEIKMRPEVLEAIMTPGFQDGRAFLLGSVAGRRAARRAAELLDLQAESTVGPVEIDWGVRREDSTVFWQAHVSAWDGTFFPAAALLAATAAAVAILDMVKALDPEAALTTARVKDEPWEAGRTEIGEVATALYKPPSPLLGLAGAASLSDTIQSDAPEMPEAGGGRAHPRPVAERTSVPWAPSSSPALAPRPSAPVVVRESPRAGTSRAVVVAVTLFAIANFGLLVAVVYFLAHARR